MNFSQMQKFEKEKAEAEANNRARQAAAGDKTKRQADLPGVRSSGQVIGMSDEERKAWFEEMRRVATGDPGRETETEREARIRKEHQKK